MIEIIERRLKEFGLIVFPTIVQPHHNITVSILAFDKFKGVSDTDIQTAIDIDIADHPVILSAGESVEYLSIEPHYTDNEFLVIITEVRRLE